MPTTPAIDATVGASTANSFATVAEFKTYWASRGFNTVPLAASDDQIAAGLVQAGRLLNSSFDWVGAAVDATQSMTWPRSGMLTRNKFPLAITTIPQELKDCQCQLAGDLIIADREEDNEAAKLGLTSVRAGSVALSFVDQISGGSSLDLQNASVRKQGPEFAWLSKAISDAARNLLVDSWYIRQSVSLPFIFSVDR